MNYPVFCFFFLVLHITPTEMSVGRQAGLHWVLIYQRNMNHPKSWSLESSEVHGHQMTQRCLRISNLQLDDVM